jgi:hypothetical protein
MTSVKQRFLLKALASTNEYLSPSEIEGILVNTPYDVEVDGHTALYFSMYPAAYQQFGGDLRKRLKLFTEQGLVLRSAEQRQVKYQRACCAALSYSLEKSGWECPTHGDTAGYKDIFATRDTPVYRITEKGRELSAQLQQELHAA